MNVDDISLLIILLAVLIMRNNRIQMRYLRFSGRWNLNSSFSGLLRRVVWWLSTNVSEDSPASIFREQQQGTPKRRYPTTRLRVATIQKTTEF